MPDGGLHDRADAPALFDRLPADVLGSLTARQKNAIAAAARARTWRSHPINIRLTVPLLPRRWYFTVVAGPERRSPERRRTERTRHPLRTAGNFAFVLLSAGVFYAIAVTTLLFSSSILE